jgi:uncharacterized protein YjbI with pentapeptide repeats
MCYRDFVRCFGRIFGPLSLTIPGEALDIVTPFLKDARQQLHRNLLVRGEDVVREVPPPQLVASYVQLQKDPAEVWRNHAKGADLRERDLRGADLSDSNLVNAHLEGTNLDDAILIRTGLQGAQLAPAKKTDGTDVPTSLRGADLSKADLRFANLSDAKLQGADISQALFHGAYLAKANLSGVRQSQWNETSPFTIEMQGAYLMGANLKGADLRIADLRGATFNYAELQGADLRQANLTGAALAGAKVQGTDLRSTILDLAELEVVKTGKLDAQDAAEIEESRRFLLNSKLTVTVQSAPQTGSETRLDPPREMHVVDAFYDDTFAKVAGIPTTVKTDLYLRKR